MQNWTPNKTEYIEIKNDWEVVNEYVDEILDEDEKLFEIASTIVQVSDYKDVVNRITDLYLEGINGDSDYDKVENPRYITLKDYILSLVYFD